MKKTINRNELHLIIRGMVTDACLKKGKKIKESIEDSHTWLKAICRLNFAQTVPELAEPRRQTELLQAGIIASSYPRINVNEWKVNKEDNKTGNWHPTSFSEKTICVGRRTEAEKQANTALWEHIIDKIPGLGMFITQSNFTWDRPSITMRTRFADVPHSPMPIKVYEGTRAMSAPTVEKHNHNDVLVAIHEEVCGHIQKLFELLQDAVTMYSDLHKAMHAIKKPEKLEEVFPEAVKHFPESLRAVPKTKEIADPAFINQLREKLAAGLPS